MNRPKAKKIHIGCDQNAISTVADVEAAVKRAGFLPQTHPASDYVSVSVSVCDAVASEPGSQGILVCGTGQGVCIVANKHHGIRAARCLCEQDARDSRHVNDANVLCLSAKTCHRKNSEIIQAFLSTDAEVSEKRSLRKLQIRAVETSSAKSHIQREEDAKCR